MIEGVARDKGLVSIIMPAYNAGTFLYRSIDSVQKQTYQNWELLIVDDGSEDDSREIAEAYASKDSRIHLICNKHGGTARARNTAIEIAKGKYFAFIDADDIYHSEYLELLMEAVHKEQADIAVCDFTKGTDPQAFLKTERESGSTVITKEEAFSRMYHGEWLLMIAPWNKIYSHRIFDTVRFPDGRYFEDAATVNLAIYHSDRICVLNQPLYFYYVTPDSSSKTKRSVELLDREWALRSHWEFFQQNKREDLALEAIPFYLIELISIYYRIEHSDKPEDCQIIRERFEKVYKDYRKRIRLSQEQKDQILAFRYPNISDIHNMIRKDGLIKTAEGFLKRKLK